MTDGIDTTQAARANAGRGGLTRLSGSFDVDVVPTRSDLFRYALRLTGNAADAEDLVQDTMFKAFKAYDRLRPDTYLRAWLLTVMKNTWITHHRDAARRPEMLLCEVTDAQVEATNTAEETRSAEYQALRDSIDPDLVAAVGELSEDMRLTVYYVAVKGMLTREVADLLGVPTNTVLTRMHRCRIALRRSLGELAEQRLQDRAA